MDGDERAAAAQRLQETPWVRALLGTAAAPRLLAGDPPVWDGMFALDSALRAQHYVAGARAPFLFRGPHLRVDCAPGSPSSASSARSPPSGYDDDDAALRATVAAATPGPRPEGARFLFREGGRLGQDAALSKRATMTWAVYAGHHAINGAYNLQGGATAAIIDYVTACAGSVIFKWGAFVLTKVNTIKYLRTAGPVPGIFKVIVELQDYDLDKGDLILHTTLTRDDIPSGERPFATAVTHMVDGPRRKRWKLRQKRGSGGEGAGGGGGSATVPFARESVSASSTQIPNPERSLSSRDGRVGGIGDVNKAASPSIPPAALKSVTPAAAVSAVEGSRL